MTPRTRTPRHASRAIWAAAIMLVAAGGLASILTVIFVQLSPTNEIYRALLPVGASLVTILLALWVSRVLMDEARRNAEQELELARLESRLVMAQKTQELLHDLANHLTVVSALIQTGADTRAREYIQRLLQNPDQEMGQVETISADANLLLGMLGPALARADRESVSLHLQLAIDGTKPFLRDDVAVRILGNLIDNALDAVNQTTLSAGRKVNLEVILGSKYCRLRVWNNGPPIPPGQLSRMFKAGETTKGHDHNGLGLHIVQQLVHEHGGELEVQSDAEEGTAFTASFRAPKGRNHSP